MSPSATRRHTLLGVLSLLLGASLACGGDSSAEAPGENMKISDDLDGLRKHISVPDGLTATRWAARARGAGGLGPTDLELAAHFPLDADAWGRLADTLGPEGEASTLAVPDALLAAVGVPSAAGASIACTPFENIRWRCGGAVRSEAGVLVYLTSR